MGRQQKGFSLVELMVALAIVGILAAISYPSYTGHMMKTRRVDAQGSLAGLSAAMERYFTENNTYAGAAGTTSGGVVTPADTGAPRIYPTQSPIDGATKYYNLTISAADASSYTLRATPISTSTQASDKCAILTLTSTGLRGAVTSGGTAISGCWQ
ncbi:MAG: type IV pilin protein [Candidatus Methylumidiphilus sp.]